MEAKKKEAKSPETFLQGMFTLPPYDKEGPHLIGGFCEQCSRKFFPRPFICPYCLGELEEVLLSNQGTLHSFAVVRVKPPFGLPLPYSLGYVDLKEDGLRVISLIDPETIDDLEIGMELILRVSELGDDGKGNPCLRYMFTPKTGKQQ
jgi:uncharacterized OB-fold protein